jgi:hypothetical protein
MGWNDRIDMDITCDECIECEQECTEHEPPCVCGYFPCMCDEMYEDWKDSLEELKEDWRE